MCGASDSGPRDTKLDSQCVCVCVCVCVCARVFSPTLLVPWVSLSPIPERQRLRFRNHTFPLPSVHRTDRCQREGFSRTEYFSPGHDGAWQISRIGRVSVLADCQDCLRFGACTCWWIPKLLFYDLYSVVYVLSFGKDVICVHCLGGVFRDLSILGGKVFTSLSVYKKPARGATTEESFEVSNCLLRATWPRVSVGACICLSVGAQRLTPTPPPHPPPRPTPPPQGGPSGRPNGRRFAPASMS